MLTRRLAAVLLLAVTAISTALPVQADYQDARLVLIERAEAHGANPAVLLRLAWCESRFDPHAMGDYGTSWGLVQLSTLETGLYWHFIEVGYTDAFDAWQAADYLARVAAGEWIHEGITLGRWTCGYKG